MTDFADQLETRVRRIFDRRFAGSPDLVTRAPGRVNLIGEHTDYNDGFVLPMAISCQTMVAARARSDGDVHILAADLDGAETCFSLRETVRPDAQAPWSNYIRGVAASLQHQGLAVAGADLVVAGNVPQGAGLSSSASLEVASGLAFAALSGNPDYDRSKIALAGQRAEHLFAGCNCGIMDQLVSARAQRGHAMLLDCRSLAVTHAPMPTDIAVMIVHSGIQRGLVDGEYNIRRQQCEAAARHYGAASLRDLDWPALEQGRAGLDPLVFGRARHVVTENQRTLAAAAALRDGDLALLGRLMAQSHASMRDDFDITTPGIDRLVAVLQAAIGDLGGARMTGGGFGGAVVALLPAAAQEAVREAVLREYQTPASEAPFIMTETAAPGASLSAG